MSSRLYGFLLFFGVSSLFPQQSLILASKRGECIATSKDTFQCFSNIAVFFCEDDEPECPEWQSNNECQRNPSYMLAHCRKSCQSCIDGHAGISQMAAPTNADRVVRRLADTAWYIKSRNLYKCHNHHAECTIWAVEDKCGSDWMKEKCPAACKQC